MNQEVGVARNIRSVEWLKAELAGGAGTVCKALLKGNPEAVADSLAGLVVSCYLLGRRVGLDYGRLDEAIGVKLELNVRSGHELETWYGDLSQLRDHLRGRRR
ncbi:MAG: MazG-like family protein [bacterium]|nr:MazG-like family protein [bacterium]